MEKTIKELYTQAEYARKIGKPRQRVYEMVRDGKLNIVHISGAILIDTGVECDVTT